MQARCITSCACKTVAWSLGSQCSSYGRTSRIFRRPYHADFTPVKPLRLPRGHSSLLPLVNACNNLVLPQPPYHSNVQSQYPITPCNIATRTVEGDIVNEEPIIPFLLAQSQHEKPVGFLRVQVAAAIEDDHQRHLVSQSASPWNLRYSKQHPKGLKSVAFAEWVNEGGKYTRTMHMERVVSDWKKHGLFTEVLKGWSDEAYPVYLHPPKQVGYTTDPIAFAIERAALPLFGLVNFGALLTAYIRHPETGRMLLWIPRRSSMKRTWPGKLDVTVGGGMGLGHTALETIVKESAEEALLDQDYVQRYIRPVGVLPSISRSLNGWILPEMHYLFDLPLPAEGSILPKRNALDGEIDKFELMDMKEVLQRLVDHEFKSSSALAIIDFLIRHGYITDETDPKYLDICRALKTDIQLPLAWRAFP